MTSRRSASVGLLIGVVVFCLSLVQVRAMTSVNYRINWDSVNSGGEDTSSSTNYRLRDTVGEQATGNSTSSNYALSAGYRVGDVDITSLSFSIGTQENTTQTPFSAFSSGSKSVIVGSVASFSVGDMIGVVENEGLSQVIAVGRIESIGGLTITVDSWNGSPNVISGTPSGGNDYVYRMNGYVAQLGTLGVSVGKTSLTATRVRSDAGSGYSVYVNDDGNLRYTTSTYILDVADGSVSIGSEEYGAQVFGYMATGTGSDFGFSTTTRVIQSSSSTASIEERVGLVYKATISSITPSGNYSHVVYYTVTANY